MQESQLPVLEIIYKAIAWPWYYRRQLGVALLPTFFAMVFLDFVSLYISQSEKTASIAVFSIIAIPLTVLYTITIHRFMVLGPESTPKFGVFEWWGREWRFLLFMFGVSILAGLLVAVPMMTVLSTSSALTDGALGRVMTFILYASAFLVFSRLSLVFPAIATDSDFSLLRAWKISRGNTIRLTVALYSIPLLSMALYKAIPEWIHENFEIYLSVVWILFCYVVWAVEIACLSFAYKYLVTHFDEGQSHGRV